MAIGSRLVGVATALKHVCLSFLHTRRRRYVLGSRVSHSAAYLWVSCLDEKIVRLPTAWLVDFVSLPLHHVSVPFATKLFRGESFEAHGLGPAASTCPGI